MLASKFTDWGVMALVAVAVVSTFLADLAIAASMETIAPTKVSIGPGKSIWTPIWRLKKLPSCLVSTQSHTAKFRYEVKHGELFERRMIPVTLTTGMSVNVVDRDGLTLVVSTRSG